MGTQALKEEEKWYMLLQRGRVERATLVQRTERGLAFCTLVFKKGRV